MSRRAETMSTGFFDDLYTASADPWDFRTSPYEQAKYADTLSVLNRRQYASAWEVGCSIGVFTRMIAARCDQLVATEPSAPALSRAREACADIPNVEFRSDSLPLALPPGRFDLIVLSEVLYYLDRADAAKAIRHCANALRPEGEIVLCHWLGETHYPLTGDEAAEIAIAEGERRGWLVKTWPRDKYRLDLIQAGPA